MADATVAADIERRFKRELLLARQVTHKNVVRIHDLGEIDGIKYITMFVRRRRGPRDGVKREGRWRSPRAADRALDRVRAGRSARGRRRPSRPQACQHHDRRRTATR